MKEVRQISRDQVVDHAKNFLLDCDDEINELLHESFLATTPDMEKVRRILIKMLADFDEYLEG